MSHPFKDSRHLYENSLHTRVNIAQAPSMKSPELSSYLIVFITVTSTNNIGPRGAPSLADGNDPIPLGPVGNQGVGDDEL